jgi:hypothetical protein
LQIEVFQADFESSAGVALIAILFCCDLLYERKFFENDLNLTIIQFLKRQVVKLQIKKSQTTYNLKQTEYILLDFVSIGNKDTKLLVGDVRSHKLLVHIEEIN